MTKQRDRIQIRQIPTGIPNLDVVLGGGIPAYSLNVVAGPPGSGKTTLVQQFIYHNSTPEQKTLFFAALSEPVLKLLRYQQQFDFFDPGKLNTSIVFFDLGTVAREEGLRRTLEVIQEQVASVAPAFLIIDSFRAIEEFSQRDSNYNVRAFMHDLGLHLAGWEITSFLVGEYTEEEMMSSPEFSVADGIIWLEQENHRNSVVRKLQVVKCRGQEAISGRHTFRISREGILLFPRDLPIPRREIQEASSARAAFGIPALDEMMLGGIPAGETCLIAGSAGTGKTLLSLHFVVEGARSGEPGVMVTFEEHPSEHVKKARGFGWDLRAMEDQKLLKMIYLRPTDLSVDEVLYQVHRAVMELGAKRVVFNSVSGFEIAVDPQEREDFREALFRLLATLTGEGVTTLLTTEIPDLMGSGLISTRGISFLSDNMVMLRFVEIESELRKAVIVVKMRSSDHTKELRQYQITGKGIVVEQPFTQYSGILSGIPTLRTVMPSQPFTGGLSEQEEALMNVLLALRDSTAQQLAEGMGVDAAEVQRILDKLVDTGYVFASARGGKTTYRVALMAPMMPSKQRER
ncbi:MAG: AAA family ATPase [Actinobacteria bacterium]|nr:AAA family ATPase [Actinomycetota bacterium]